MGRTRIGVADVKEILVRRAASTGNSGIALGLGHSRPTVRRYVQTSQRAWVSWRLPSDRWAVCERAARAAIAHVPAEPSVGDVGLLIAASDEHLTVRVERWASACCSSACAIRS